MYRKFTLALLINFGNALYAAMPAAAAAATTLPELTPLQHLQSIDFALIQQNQVIPNDFKKSLGLKLRCILMNPAISKEAAFLVLKDCVAFLVNCQILLDRNLTTQQTHSEKILLEKAAFMQTYGIEMFWLIRNLTLHVGNIYYNGSIPEGILDITPAVSGRVNEEKLPHLVHLKTESGSVFLAVPYLEPEKITTSYVRLFVVSARKALIPIDLFYNGKKTIHESGFYLDLDNSDGYLFSLGGYFGSVLYQMGKKHLVSRELFPDIDTFTADNPNLNSLLTFVIGTLGGKIGGLQNLRSLRTAGEVVFLPFPITQKDKEEAVYAEDLFQAEQAIQDLSRATFLLTLIPEHVDDVNQQTENIEKRRKVLEKKQLAEKRLARLAEEYQTTPKVLIATLEGKLLALNEAEYQQKIQDEQAKIRDQLEERSKPGITAGKKHSSTQRAKAKVDDLEEERRPQQSLSEITHHVRSEFLKDICGRHKDRQHVLKAFHKHLIRHEISFHETQSGSHRVTHTRGAAPVTVVEEHRGTAEFSGSTIRKMLSVFESAIRQKFFR